MFTYPRNIGARRRRRWTAAFALVLAVDLAAWWQHHVWIAGTLAVALCWMLVVRIDR